MKNEPSNFDDLLNYDYNRLSVEELEVIKNRLSVLIREKKNATKKGYKKVLKTNFDYEAAFNIIRNIKQIKTFFTLNI